jgi:hypothetical protein
MTNICSKFQKKVKSSYNYLYNYSYKDSNKLIENKISLSQYDINIVQ